MPLPPLATEKDDGYMPEGDTVWLAARRMHDALADCVSHPHQPDGTCYPVRHVGVSLYGSLQEAVEQHAGPKVAPERI